MTDFYNKKNKALKTLSNWHRSGALKVFIDKYSGLESAPEALINLLSGKNSGKTIVEL